MLARDYKKIRVFRRKCGVKLKIKYRRGLPFILRKYKRIGLAVGAVIIVLTLVFMPKFVWRINVSGLEALQTEQVLEALETVGIDIGTKLSEVDADNMRLRLALLLPEISWASINLDGTTVNVEVREGTKRLENDNKYSNLVAEYDGIIKAVYVRSGTAAVKVGDAVVKDDLLVSGLETYKDGRTFFRHSDADIIAEINRSITVCVPKKSVASKDISEGERRTALSLFGIDIPLYIGEFKYPCRAEYEETPLVINGVCLPISLKISTYYKTEETDIMLTEQAALQKAEKRLSLEEQEHFSNYKILEKKIDTAQTEAEYVFTVKYLLSGNIAKTKYLDMEMQK